MRRTRSVLFVVLSILAGVALYGMFTEPSVPSALSQGNGGVGSLRAGPGLEETESVPGLEGKVARRRLSEGVTVAALTVRARCVDASNLPLVGVEMTVRERSGAPQSAAAQEVATSDDYGRVEVAIDISRDVLRTRPFLMIIAGRPGWTYIHRQKQYASDVVLYDLGTLVFAPAGVVTGSVLLDGRPVKGAGVRVVDPVSEDVSPQVKTLRAILGRGFAPYSATVELLAGVPLSTVTDSNGRYRLVLPESSIAVAAKTYAADCSYISPVSVRPGVELELPPILLKPTDSANLIRGHVYGLDGAPLPDAVIRCFENRQKGGGAKAILSTLSGEGGGFSIPALPGSLYTLTAHDRRYPDHGAWQHDVSPGTASLRLVVPARRSLSVVVQDLSGRALVPDQILLKTSGRPAVSVPFESKGGGWEISAPTAAFQLGVNLTGYTTTAATKVKEGESSRPIVIQLRPTHILRGRVVLPSGAAAKGAVVDAHRGANGLLKYRVGLFSRVAPRVMGLAEADERGEFQLGVLDEGTYVIHAHRSGFAMAEQEVEIGRHEQAMQPITLTLGATGAIRGRLAPGEEAKGQMVAATAGNGHVVWTKVASDGTFRFSEVTPGGWQLARCNGDHITDFKVGRAFPDHSVDRLPVHAVVHAGKTTQFEFRSLAEVAIRGRLVFGSSGTGNWIVSVSGEGSSRTGRTDARGHFEVRVNKTGAATLSMTRSLDGVHVALKKKINVSAANEDFGIHTNTGGVDLRSLERVTGGSATSLPEYALLFEQNSSGDSWTMLFTPSKDGRFVCDEVPLGIASVRRRSKRSFDGILNWEEIGRVEVTRGLRAELKRSK